MPVRTQLEPEQAQALLRQYHLQLRGLTPLPGGSINSNYRVQTDVGPLFLRINEGKTEHDVRFEAALIWHLNSKGLPTPPLWRTRRGEPYVLLPGAGPPKPVMLMAWIDGEEHTEDAITDAEAATTGELLGRLHVAAADFPQKRPGSYTLEHIRGRIERLRQDPQVPDGIVEFLDREGQRLSTARRDLPGVVGHQDLFPDNLLFGRQAGAARRDKQAWLLDLEQAATVPYAYDVAVALLSFCAPTPAAPSGEPAPPVAGDHPLLLGRARALLRGYAAVRPLTEADKGGLYEEARFAALRFTVTRLTDIYLSRVRPQTRHSKDYRDYLRRLQGLMAMTPDDFRAPLFA